MINYVIIDDEINNIEILSSYLDKHQDKLKLVGTALNVDEGIKLIKKEQPELIFLDIQMPDKNGFDLLTEIGDRNFEVIFVTAYDKFGIQAIKFSALDYLLKPLHIGELEETLYKAVEKINLKKYNANLENLIQNLNNKQHDEDKIALSIGRETRYIPVAHIIRCRADNNYTEIYLLDGQMIVMSKTLKEYHEMLSQYGFIRTHQSHLINPKHVLGSTKGDAPVVHMRNNFLVPVSRQKKEYVYQILKQTIKP